MTTTERIAHTFVTEKNISDFERLYHSNDDARNVYAAAVISSVLDDTSTQKKLYDGLDFFRDSGIDIANEIRAVVQFISRRDQEYSRAEEDALRCNIDARMQQIQRMCDIDSETSPANILYMLAHAGLVGDAISSFYMQRYVEMFFEYVAPDVARRRYNVSPKLAGALECNRVLANALEETDGFNMRAYGQDS